MIATLENPETTTQLPAGVIPGRWYFSYGSNHEDATGVSLGSRYTVVEVDPGKLENDRGYGAARQMMFEARGDKWSMQYDHADEIGVNRFGLTEATLQEVTISEAPKDNFDLAVRQMDWKRNSLLEQLANLDVAILLAGKLPAEIIAKCSAYDGGLDIDHLTRDQVVIVMRTLNGGKWTETVNGQEARALDYTTELNGIRIRLWAAAPPETCQVVEVEEIIPAQPEQRRIVRKLICSPSEPAAVEKALAAIKPQ